MSAQPKSSKPLVLDFSAFSGGAVVVSDPTRLQPQVQLKSENVVYDELGTVSKRLGSKAMGTNGTSGIRALSGAVYQKAGAAIQYVVHFSDGTIGVSANLSVWTTIKSGLSTTAPMSFALFTDLMFMSNGVDSFQSWDGTAGATVTYATVPKFKYLEVWRDTVWGSGDSANAHRVYSSAPGDGTTWPAINFVDVAKGQGFGVSGLSSDANALVVFKGFEVHALYDPVEFTNRIVDPEKGCISHFSIVKFDGVIYFASHRGICQYLGDAPSKIVSKAIEPLFTNYVYDESNAALWYGYSYSNHVGWSYPRDSATDFQQIEYYPGLETTPWVFQNMPARVILNARQPGLIERLIGWSEGSNEVFRLMDDTVFKDGTVAFAAIISTGWEDFGVLQLMKYIYCIEAICRGEFTISFYKDLDDSTVVDTVVVTDSGTEILKDIEGYTDIYARLLRVEISDASTFTQTNRKIPIGSETETVIEGAWSISKFTVNARQAGHPRG